VYHGSVQVVYIEEDCLQTGRKQQPAMLMTSATVNPGDTIRGSI